MARWAWAPSLRRARQRAPARSAANNSRTAQPGSDAHPRRAPRRWCCCELNEEAHARAGGSWERACCFPAHRERAWALPAIFAPRHYGLACRRTPGWRCCCLGALLASATRAAGAAERWAVGCARAWSVERCRSGGTAAAACARPQAQPGTAWQLACALRGGVKTGVAAAFRHRANAASWGSASAPRAGVFAAHTCCVCISCALRRWRPADTQQADARNDTA
jgi:hypothetical protein